MADRTVSVRLQLNVADFRAGGRNAKRTLSELDRKFTQSAGFAKGFRKKLEDAVKKLPKIDIDANSKPAEVKVAELRAKLEKLSKQEVGVDIDAASAFTEMAAIQAELEAIEKDASFELKADTGAALAEIQTVLAEIKRISNEKVTVAVEPEGGAFAQKLKAQVEAAAASLPKIAIDADSSPAQRQIAELRSRLESLSSKTVGVDINAAAAMAEIRAIENQLRGLSRGASIDVRVDAGDALSQLDRIQTTSSSMDGRTSTVRVLADVGSALLGIAAVGAALAALPAAASVGIGITALGGAFAAAGAGALGFGAVAIPTLSRVNEALQEAESSAGGAGGAMKSAAQSAAEAASNALRLAQANDRIRDSAQGVIKAKRAVQDALQDVRDAQEEVRTSQENAAAAAERVNEVSAAGARRVADAERTLADAHRATQMAVEDLTRARERAIERIEDLELATKRGSLDEEGARLAIERAKQRLDAVNADPKATELSKREADLAYREALQRLDEVIERNGDLTKEKAESDRKGVEGSDEVTAAKERIAEASRREQEAEQAVGEARTQAARDTAAAQRDAAEASRDVARSLREVGDAQRKVAEAQQAVIKAQRDELRARQALKVEQLQQKAAMEQAGAAAGGAATKMSKLSAEERKLAKDIKAFTDSYEAWQQSLQPDIFPVIRSGMDLMSTGMEIGTPLIKASAFAFGTLVERINAGLKSDQWTSFFEDLTTHAPRAIEGLGTAAGNVAGGLAGIIQAFLPYTGDLLTWVENITQKFEDWGQSLGESQGFKAFIAYAQENLPKVQQVLGNLGIAIEKILEAASGSGAGALDFLVTLSEKLAQMTPEQYEAIGKGIAAVFAAANLGATLKIGGLVLLADVLSQMSPGQIQAAALAIAGLIVAAKGYQAVSAASGVWEKLSSGIDKAGDAAQRTKGKLGGLGSKLSGLGEAAGAVGGVLAATTALGMLDSSLNGLDTKLGSMSTEMAEFGKTGQLSGKLAEQWGDSLDTVVKDVGSWDEAIGRASGTSESFREAISRLANPGPLEGFKSSYLGLMNVVTLGTTEFDKSAEQIGFMDQELANLVSNGNASEAEQAFARFVKEAQAMGVPVEKLKEVFPQYTEAVNAAGAASATAAGGIDAAKQQTDGLNKAIDTFAARTDAVIAIRAMETAYKDAAAAIEAANGKLSISRGMTDQQRDAVIRARESFSGYIESIRTAAEGAATLSGKQTDGTRTILEQLPRLAELAGKSSEAKSQILLLAQAYGISATDAEKAMKGGKSLRDVLAELKSKQIKIDMDTKQAQANLDNVRRTLIDIARRTDLQLKGGLNPTSALGNAWGGIQHRSGSRPDYMASGGLRSVGSSPSAMITKTPALISGRSGTDVIFGEAGWEAFIPLDSSKRGRGLQILSEAAEIMGMAVVAEKTAINGAASTSTGGSYTGSAGGAMVTVTGVDALRSALTITTVGLTDSLGAATNTLDAALGEAGTLTGAVDGLGQAATGWGEVIAVQIPPLTDAVTQLGDAISAAASGDSKGSASSKGGTKGSSKSNSKGNTGSKGDERSPRDAAKKAEPKKTAILGATSGTSGVALSGGPTNWSQVSRPVQSYSSGGGSSPAPSSGASAAGGSAGQASGGGGVNVYGMVVRSEADIGQVAAQISMRRRGRG